MSGLDRDPLCLSFSEKTTCRKSWGNYSLNDDELELEMAIAAYEKGMELKKICEQRLKEAKLRIENIKEENETN